MLKVIFPMSLIVTPIAVPLSANSLWLVVFEIPFVNVAILWVVPAEPRFQLALKLPTISISIDIVVNPFAKSYIINEITIQFVAIGINRSPLAIGSAVFPLSSVRAIFLWIVEAMSTILIILDLANVIVAILEIKSSFFADFFFHKLRARVDWLDNSSFFAFSIIYKCAFLLLMLLLLLLWLLLINFFFMCLVFVLAVATSFAILVVCFLFFLLSLSLPLPFLLCAF